MSCLSRRDTFDINTVSSKSLIDYEWVIENGYVKIDLNSFKEILIYESYLLEQIRQKDTLESIIVGDKVASQSFDLKTVYKFLPSIMQNEFTYNVAKMYACYFMTLLSTKFNVESMTEAQVLEIYRICVEKGYLRWDFYVLNPELILKQIDSNYTTKRNIYNEPDRFILKVSKGIHSHFMLENHELNIIYDSYNWNDRWTQQFGYKVKRRTPLYLRKE
jgi:hypothetical protein